ncbi:MAG: hypothetical protein ACI4JF_04290 [Oscillospiraceae bacterium]
MASIRRERLFEQYRDRMSAAKSNLNKCFMALMIPFGGLWLGLTLYYFIKGLALLAGSGMFFGQLIDNYASGKNEPLPLTYKIPYLLMFYLFMIFILSAISRGFRKKGINYALEVIFVASFIYGFVCIFFSLMPVYYSVLLMAASIYGFWVCDITLRQYKELDFLSKQEGYPDFVDLVGEPVPMANTRGVYMRQYELLKEQAHKRTKDKLDAKDSDSCVDVGDYLTEHDNTMDELTTGFDEPIDELLKKAK